LCEEGLPVYAVLPVRPEVVREHGDQRDDEEGCVDVGYEIRFRVRVVCEDGLSHTLSAQFHLTHIFPFPLILKIGCTHTRQKVTRRPQEDSRKQEPYPHRMPDLPAPCRPLRALAPQARRPRRAVQKVVVAHVARHVANAGTKRRRVGWFVDGVSLRHGESIGKE
jgi:hypothetical protein